MDMAPKNNIKAVVQERWEGGWSIGKKVGIKNSSAFIQAFDFRKSPSQMSVLPGLQREDNGIVRDLVQNEVMTSDGTIYAIGDQGTFYKRTTGGTWSAEASVGHGTFGLDYRKDTDSIYVPTRKSVSLYNNVSGVSGSPAMYMNFYGPSFSTLDNTDTVGFYCAAFQPGPSGQSYIPPTAINESQTNERFFQSDIEPLVKISIFVLSKGTGDWTLTLHDGNNNVLGTSTVGNASIVNNTFNDFAFSTATNGQVRIYVAPNARTYHIHVTSTVADGSLSTSVASDLSTCSLEVWADRLVMSNNGMHPLVRFQEYECFGNANYVSVWEPISVPPTNAEWQRHRLVFPMEYENCGLASTNEYLVAAFEKPLSSAVSTSTANTLPGTGSNVTGVGSVAWSNPSNITAEDGNYATVDTSLGDSNYLEATNFGFNLPNDATVIGITAQFYRHDVSNGAVVDSIVSLIKAGTVTGENKAGQPWQTSDTLATYGSGTDVWGTTLTASDVNASNFGVALSVTTEKIGGLASVDYVLMTVYYTTAGTALYNSIGEGLLAFWDGVSPTYNYFLTIPEGSPYGVHTYKNVVYYYAGGDWYSLTSPTTLPVKIWSMPGSDTEFSQSNSPVIVYPNAATVRRGIHLMAYPSTTTNSDINFGVYSWGAVDKNFPEAFGYNYLISTGSQNYSVSNNLTIGMVKNFGDVLHVSWRDTSSDGGYGLDVITNSSQPASTAIWQGMVFDNGYVGKQKLGLFIDCNYFLPPGATIQLAYALDQGDFVEDPNIYTSTNLWQGRPGYARFKVTFGNQGRFYSIQPQIIITCDDTVTAPPIVYMVSTVYDSLQGEALD